MIKKEILEAMANQTDSPFEAEIARKLLKKQFATVEELINIPKKRPRKKTLLIVDKICSETSCKAVKRDNGFFWIGTRGSVDNAIEKLREALSL